MRLIAAYYSQTLPFTVFVQERLYNKFIFPSSEFNILIRLNRVQINLINPYLLSGRRDLADGSMPQIYLMNLDQE
ncbi:MAG: hypothetical protein V7K48_28440 [Nostoc sp.]|uniref:hypothetical protein n=1 Tax=Nostoc sp. TaxID=1180 RepID=UPI002FFCF874